MRRSAIRRLSLGAVSALLILWACTDASDVSSPMGGRGVRLSFAPQFSYLGGNYFGEPINRIRLTARDAATGAVVAAHTVDVSPDAQEWNIPLDVTLPNGNPVSLLVTVELINVSSTGQEAVQWSGVTAPINVTPGQNAPPPAQPITLVQGPVQNLTVTDVAVSPGSDEIDEGATLQLNATIVGGGPGALAVWSSLDPDVASVNQSGLVSGLRNGTARIVAVSGPQADTAEIVVRQRVSAIAISPDTQRIAAFDDEAAFTARVLDPRGAQIDGAAVNWSSSNTNIAEHIGNGVFRARGNGTAQVTATSATVSSVNATAVLVVNQRAQSVHITPASASLNAIGAAQPFNAEVRDARNHAMGAPVSWRSTNSQVASITAAGVATATGIGSTDIVAVANAGTADSIVATASLQVTQAVATVEILPDVTALHAINDTAHFAAIARDAQSTPIADVVFAWSTSNASVATVDGAGNVIARGNGSATITVTAGGHSAGVEITVQQIATSLTVSPVDATTAVGDTTRFTAAVSDANTQPITNAPVVWSTSDNSKATVDNTGLALGRAPGPVTVTATLGTLNGNASLLVQHAPPASVVINEQSPRINAIGFSTQLSAVVRDRFENELPATVTWSSLDPEIASVSAAGLVTALQAGQARIVASVNPADTVLVEIAQVVKSVTVAPDSATLVVGDSVMLTAAAVDSSDTPIAGIVWSSNSAAASVDNDGKVKALAPGTAIISAAVGGVVATASITVLVPVVADLLIDSVTVVPDTAYEGASIFIVGYLRNAGTGASGLAFGRARVLDAANDTVIFTAGFPIPPLAAGDTTGGAMSVAIDTTINWPDALKAEIVLDTANAVAETNESNNTFVTQAYPVRFRVASLQLAPTQITLDAIGDTASITATLRDRYNRILNRPVLFAAREEAIATVSSAGLVTAVATGSTWIYAVAETRLDSVEVNVAQAAETIELSTTFSTTFTSKNDTAFIVALVKDPGGTLIPDAVVTWTSSDSTKVRVYQTGRVDAVGNGQATITASSGAASSSMIWTVQQVAHSVAITPPADTIPVAGSVQLMGSVADARANEIVGTPITWTSSDTIVASVLPSGLATGRAPGVAIITASVGALTGTALITVVAGPPANIMIEGVADRIATVDQDAGDSLSVTVTDADGNPVDGAEVEWITSNNGGHVTAPSRPSLDVSSVGGGMRISSMPPLRTFTVSGRAKVKWKFPTKSGQHTVQACVVGLPDVCATFNGFANPDRPNKANKKTDTDDQLVTVNQIAPNALELTVTDQFENPTPNATVEWSLLAADHGSLSISTTTTDANGVATVTWTMPTTRGTFFVNFRVKDGADVVATGQFKANAKPDKPKNHNRANDDQTVTVNQTAPNALELILTDEFNNAIDGATVNWSLREGHVAGQLSASSSVTDVGGQATVGWENIGTKAGVVFVDYSITHDDTTITGSFKARARAAKAAKGGKHAGDEQEVIVARVAANALEVSVLDAFDNPTHGTVEWSVVGALGSLSANSTTVDTLTGKATVEWTMPTVKGRYAVIFSVKDTASVTVATDTFKATAKPDKPRNHNRANDDQTVTVNQTAPNALELTLTDRFDNPIEGAAVNWVLRGAGPDAALSAASTTTNEDGTTSVTWTSVGKTAGQVFVDYSVTHDDTTITGSFKARARAAKAAKGDKNAGDEQEVIVDRVAPNALEVTVLDAYDNPTRGTVEWSVVNDMGSVSSSFTTVDTLTGKAIVQWTMPTAKGRYAVRFTVKDTAGVAVATDTFKATAKPDKPRNHIRANDDQTVTVNQTAPNTLELTLTDRFNNAIEGAVVNWSLRGAGPDADLSAPNSTTDENGTASVAWTNVGKTAGPVFVDYNVTHDDTTVIGSFKARARAAKAAKGNKSAGDEQEVVVNRIAPNALEVIVLDAFDNPTRGTVEWLLQDAGGELSESSTTVDTLTGKATVQWAMPTAKGRYKVIFTVKDTAGVTVAGDTFKATAKPDKPRNHNRANDDQTVTVNQTAPNALELTLTDLFNNAIEGATVNWSLRDAGPAAALSAASSTTDADGKATVSWSNVGKTAGFVFVDYSVTHDDTTVTGSFRARARAGKATKANKNSGDEQEVIVNRIAPNALEVIVRDGFDNPTRGTVDWTLVGSAGVLSANSTTVDTITGEATVEWAMPTTKGRHLVIFSVKDTAGIEVATDTFRVTAKPDKPSVSNSSRKNPGQSKHDATVAVELTDTVAIEFKDQFGNTVENVPVSWIKLGGDSSTIGLAEAETDTGGTVIGRWVLGKKSGPHVIKILAGSGEDTASVILVNTTKAGPVRKLRFNQSNPQIDALEDSSTVLSTAPADEFDNDVNTATSWASADGSKLAVRATGLLRSHGNGTVYIRGTADGFTDSVAVTIRQRIRSLELSADTLTALQINKRLRRTQRDRNNMVIDSAWHEDLTWTSSNPLVATVDPNTGIVTSVSNGFSTITATALSDNTVLATVVVEVRQAASDAGITFEGANGSAAPTAMVVGQTITLVAKAVDAENNPVAEWRWSASNNQLVDFLGSGPALKLSTIQITAEQAGTVTITATDAANRRNASHIIIITP